MKNNKLRIGISLAAISFLMVLNFGTTFAMGETVDPAYNAHTEVADLNFSAALNNAGEVETSWTEYMPVGFNYYKVVRSQDNQDPVYPDDGYIFYGQAGDLAYTDTAVPAGTSYYRVCSIAKPDRFCSPVTTITNGEANVTPVDPVNPVDPATLAVITLEGSADQALGKFLLNWTVDDDTKITNGFKVAYSKTNTEPVYPGDSYHYLSDLSVRSDKITDAKVGYDYYIRVCQYDGAGTCLAYSNAITLKLEGDTTVSTEPTNKDEVLENDFYDTSDHWAQTYAETLKMNCDVYGYKNEVGDYLNEFMPDTAITRAELVKMLVQCKYGEVSGETLSFEDVDTGAWYAASVSKAKKLGWVEGYTDGTFKPNSKVNRAEALKMILLSVYVDSNISGGTSDFSDISGSEWFAKYVKFAVKMAYVQGYADGSFRTGNDITRGEVAKIISLVHGL